VEGENEKWKMENGKWRKRKRGFLEELKVWLTHGYTQCNFAITVPVPQ
jgi:hypothetical protein